QIRKGGRKRLSRGYSSQGAGERVGEVNVVGGRLVREGRILSSVVHIVALNTLVENAKPAPEDRLAIPEDIVSEANSRFPGVILVQHVAAWKSVDACLLNAVQIELFAVGIAYIGVATKRGQRSWIQRPARGNGIPQ